MPEKTYSLENNLVQALGDEVAKSWLDESPPSTCRDPSLLSSSWQKAIRRGRRNEAIGSALALLQLDPDYVWRRMRGIALEEVSVADLELVAQVLAVAGKRVLQKKLGERRLLVNLTARLAAAPKCRTACDLLMWLPPPAQSWTRITGEPLFNWRALGLSDVAGLRHTAGLWKSIAAQSVRTPSGWRSVTRGDALTREAWLEAAEMPPLARFIVQRGSSTDTLNVLLVPVYQLAQGGAQYVAVPASSPTSSEVIGALPAYSYCLFSAPGRAALRRFLVNHEGWRRHFREIGVTDSLRALGHLVFQLEGSYCAQVLQFPRAAEIKMLSEIETLARFGVPVPKVPELRRQIATDLPALNVARRAIAAAIEP